MWAQNVTLRGVGQRSGIGGLPREAQRPRREGVLQVVSYLRCELISMPLSFHHTTI